MVILFYFIYLVSAGISKPVPKCSTTELYQQLEASFFNFEVRNAVKGNELKFASIQFCFLVTGRELVLGQLEEFG